MLASYCNHWSNASIRYLSLKVYGPHIQTLMVSGTHAIVGALLGFAMMSDAVHTIQWETLLKIAISWIASPFIQAVITMTHYDYM